MANIHTFFHYSGLSDIGSGTEEILFEMYDRFRHHDTFLGLGIVGMDELLSHPSQRQIIPLQARPYEDDPVSGSLTLEVKISSNFSIFNTYNNCYFCPIFSFFLSTPKTSVKFQVESVRWPAVSVRQQIPRLQLVCVVDHHVFISVAILLYSKRRRTIIATGVL